MFLFLQFQVHEEGPKIQRKKRLAIMDHEGFGPDKIAVIVEALTDNKNRTVAEVRHAYEFMIFFRLIKTK